MRHIKVDCDYCPGPNENASRAACQDWETHPSLITGMEALNAYSTWVSSVVLPVAFQWIDEHRSEVYATVPEELRDDVGTVVAAAFKLIKDLPAYQRGIEKSAAYDVAVANGDTTKFNPVWTEIVAKVRTGTADAFAGQTSLRAE